METRTNPDQISATFSGDEALGSIAVFEQMAMQMGANDYEPSAFQAIKNQLTSGEISPEVAVARAQGILDSKQDYH